MDASVAAKKASKGAKADSKAAEAAENVTRLFPKGGADTPPPPGDFSTGAS
jgi:hypothetical protein